MPVLTSSSPVTGGRPALPAMWSDALPDHLWTASAEGRIEFLNASARAFLGAEVDKVRTEGWPAVVHPDDVEAHRERWSQARAAGEWFEQTCRLRRAEGGYRWHLMRACLHLDETGERQWIGTNTDIHDRRLALGALHEQTRELEIINEINAALAAELDLETLVQQVTNAGTELSGAQFGAFFYNTVDERGESYMLYTLSGVPREAFERYPMPRNTAIFAPTFNGEGIMRLDDVTKDARYGQNAPYHGMPEGHLPVRSYLAVPVVSHSGEVLGGLFFGHEAPGVFTERAERIVGQMATQAAIGIDNARLFRTAHTELAERVRAEQELKRLAETLERRVAERTAELATLNEQLSHEVAERRQAEAALERRHALDQLLREVAVAANEAADFEAALQATLDQICTYMGWPVGHAYIADELSGRLVSTGLWYLADPDCFAELRSLTAQVAFELGEGLPGQVAKRRAPIWVNDVRQEPDFQRVRLANDLDVGAAFAFPVLDGQRPHAVLEFFAEDAHRPDKALLSMVGQIGEQLSRVYERQRAAQELRERGFQLSRAQEIAHLGSWEWNVRTGALRWSDELYRIYGFTPGEEISYEKYLSTIHPDDRALVRSTVERTLETHEPYSFFHRLRRADGTERIVRGEGQAQVSADGSVEKLFGTALDVTEAKQAEQALEATNRVLEQRNRELQDFAYIASHDLQEPLRKINAFADLLIEDFGDHLDRDAHDYLDRIRGAAGRMARLIADLLSFSRIATQARPFERVDLNDVVAAALTDLDVRLAESGGEVNVGNLCTVEADPTQMRQLLQNLIANALKFHRPDAPPVVEVTSRTEAAAHGTVCQLTVRDNGIGFNEKYLDRIFTPFQRLHGRDTYEGTGMGLAICRRIAERHGGAITAQSVPGQGATFIITLPLRQRKASPSPSP